MEVDRSDLRRNSCVHCIHMMARRNAISCFEKGTERRKEGGRRQKDEVGSS